MLRRMVPSYSWRVVQPNQTGGVAWPMRVPQVSVSHLGLLTLLFLLNVSRANRSILSAAIQRSIFAIHCFSLNKLILACYHSAWFLSPNTD